jgi:hypothetical protein
MNWSEFDIDRLGADLEHDGMSDSEIDEFFAHYGVPGMKWGVRKAAQKGARRQEKQLSDKTKKTIDYNAGRYSRRTSTGLGAVFSGSIAANVAALVAGSAALPIAAPVFAAGAVGGGILLNRSIKKVGRQTYIRTKNDLKSGKLDSSR